MQKNKQDNKNNEDEDEELVDSDQPKVFFLQVWKEKFLSTYEKMLINPTNKKLSYFHLLVSICSFSDIFLTGVILSNYRFTLGYDDDFMNHRISYTLICFV